MVVHLFRTVALRDAYIRARPHDPTCKPLRPYMWGDTNARISRNELTHQPHWAMHHKLGQGGERKYLRAREKFEIPFFTKTAITHYK